MRLCKQTQLLKMHDVLNYTRANNQAFTDSEFCIRIFEEFANVHNS